MGKKVTFAKSNFNQISEDEVINNLIEQRKLQQEALIKIISHIDASSNLNPEEKEQQSNKAYGVRKRPPD